MPFFPRILVHLVGLDHGVSQRVAVQPSPRMGLVISVLTAEGGAAASFLGRTSHDAGIPVPVRRLDERAVVPPVPTLYLRPSTTC
jgi:hypothetical protein